MSNFLDRQKYLYVARCGSLIKIGVSVDPEWRVERGLRYDPIKRPGITAKKQCSIVKIVAGTRREEQSLHEALGDYRVCGEWYRPGCFKSPDYKAIFNSRENLHKPGRKLTK